MFYTQRKRTTITFFLALMVTLSASARMRTVYAIRLDSPSKSLYFSTNAVSNMGGTTYSLSAEPEYFNIYKCHSGGYYIQSTKTGKYAGVNKWRFTNNTNCLWDIARIKKDSPTTICRHERKIGFGVDVAIDGAGVFTDKYFQKWVLEPKEVDDDSLPIFFVYDHDAMKACVAGVWDREINSVVIPTTVKDNLGREYSVLSISGGAFFNCSLLKSVTIPEGILQIGPCAFTNCSSLSSISIPASVTSIGNAAFLNCYMNEANFVNNSQCKHPYVWGLALCDTETEDGLIIMEATLFGKEKYSGKSVKTVRRCRPWATAVTIPEGVEAIDKLAFGDCTSLAEIMLPDGVKIIGDRAFENCSSAKNFVMPKSLIEIGNNAFKYCDPKAILVMGNGKQTSLKKMVESPGFYVGEDGKINTTIMENSESLTFLYEKLMAIAAVDYKDDNQNIKKDTIESLRQIVPNEDNVIYNDVVEDAPMFPEGNDALPSWVSSHIQYPAVAREKEIQGKVVVKFVVCDDGSIGDVVVLQKLHPACDAEAVRVIKSLPRFIPGKQKGKAVNTWFTFPVRFSLVGVI